jgi:hypothetical protein
MGFFAPTARKATESTSWTSRNQATKCLPKQPSGYLSIGPTRLTTEPLTGFLNLSATFFLLLPPSHFQAGSTLGVVSFRGLIL